MKKVQIFSIILQVAALLIFSNGSSQSYVPNAKNLTEYHRSTPLKAKEEGIDTLDDWSKKWFYITEAKIYGGGSILGLATATEETDKNASPTGSLGFNLGTHHLGLSVFFSFNTKQKVEISNLSQYGNSLINPNLGGESLSFDLRAGVRSYFDIIVGLKIADNIYTIEGEDIDASPMKFYIGGSLKPFIFEITNNDVQVSLDFAITSRSFIGDISNSTIRIDDQRVFDKTYTGLDISLNARLNKVKLYTQFSLNKKGDFNIPGFSGTQVLFGLDVTGDLITLKGSDAEEKEKIEALKKQIQKDTKKLEEEQKLWDKKKIQDILDILFGGSIIL